MRLLELPDKSLILKGYSKSSTFIMCNTHPKLYVLFKVESHPAGEFIVIPENGIIGPQETKELKVYLSKISMHKEKLTNSFIQVNADLKYRYNQTIAEEENLPNWSTLQEKTQTIVLPVHIGNEYTQFKSNLHVPADSRTAYRGTSAEARTHPINASPLVMKKDDSFNSSISMHSEHVIHDIKPIEAMKFQIKPKNVSRQISPPPANVNMQQLISHVTQPMPKSIPPQQMYPVSQKPQDAARPIHHAIDSDIRRSVHINNERQQRHLQPNINIPLVQAVDMDIWAKTKQFNRRQNIPPSISVSQPNNIVQPVGQYPSQQLINQAVSTDLRNNQHNPLKAMDMDLRMSGTHTLQHNPLNAVDIDLRDSGARLVQMPTHSMSPQQHSFNGQTQQGPVNQIANAIHIDRQMREATIQYSPTSSLFRQPDSNIMNSFGQKQQYQPSRRMQQHILDPMHAVTADIQQSLGSSHIRQDTLNYLPNAIGVDMRYQQGTPQRHRYEPLVPYGHQQPQLPSSFMDISKLRARRNNLINQLSMLEHGDQIRDPRTQLIVMVLFIAIMIAFGSYFRYF